MTELKKYLIRNGEKYYTVTGEELTEITPETGKQPVEDITVISSLWVRVSPLEAVKDTGNARAFVFPIKQGKTYNITLVGVGDRQRMLTTTDDPRGLVNGESVAGVRLISNVSPPVTGVVVTFTARENENYFVYHASASKEEPETTVDFNISALVNAFITHGIDEIPNGNLLIGMDAPDVLYWQNIGEELPTITATVTGTPSVQSIVTNTVDMTDETIKGIESVTIDASDDVLFAISFDEKTWWAYTGGEWVELSQENAGMTGAEITNIGVTAWAQKATTGKYKMRFTLTSINSYVRDIIVHYLH